MNIDREESHVKIKIRDFGFKYDGTRAYPQYHLLEETEVSAVSDPEERKSCFSNRWRAKAFTDHRDLLASGIADVLVIASPNHTHIDLLPDALSSGLPILVEKPLCTTVPDCEAIVELAGDVQPWQVVMEYRYMPPVTWWFSH